MTDELSADPVTLARFAREVLVATTAFTDAIDDTRDGWSVPAAAFGDTSAAPAVAAAAEVLRDETIARLSDVQDVLTTDVESLYQVAFAVQSAEEANTARLKEVG
ncbi:hypothetical protein [Sphaerisporangium rufum]|nr:hypothetical protein [Sphaerisporangium rufum]